MRTFTIVAIAAGALLIGVGGWFVLAPRVGDGPGDPGASAAWGTLDDFDQRVRDYILKNPEVVAEALRTYSAQQRTSAVDELKIIIASRSSEIFNDPRSPVGGNPNGDASFVEFFDYNCPYCRAVARTMIELESGDPKLRIVYKEFPILGPDSTFAARAALASVKQGKYIEFHRAMMQASGRISESKVLEVAATVGLDAARLKEDMADPEIEKAIERNLELASALRINGTPTFIAGTERLIGAADLRTLQRLVAQARGQ